MIRYGGELFSVPTPQYGLAAQLLQSLTNIYYGRDQHPWAVEVENSSFTNLSSAPSVGDSVKQSSSAALL